MLRRSKIDKTQKQKLENLLTRTHVRQVTDVTVDFNSICVERVDTPGTLAPNGKVYCSSILPYLKKFKHIAVQAPMGSGKTVVGTLENCVVFLQAYLALCPCENVAGMQLQNSNRVSDCSLVAQFFKEQNNC